MAVLVRHGIGIVDDQLIKHEAGVQVGAEHLRRASEELGPMFIKLGQMLSTRGDLLPKPYRTELASGVCAQNVHRRQFMLRAPRDENKIEASVTIERPVDEVFTFYRDFKNLPGFLGDVMRVEQIGPATSRWTIQGPLGIRASWTIKITEERTNELISYETVTLAPLKTHWEISFYRGPEAGETEVREVMKVPLGTLGRVALALIGKFPAQEVASNLHRLKQLMETGRVTDTSYSVPGKFARR